MRSVVRSNGLRNGDIASSSRSALVMPPGEKAALFYHRLDDVCDVVTDLLKDSVRQGEMCVFMFRSPLATLKEMVKARGLDLDAQPSIVLVPMSKAPIDSYDRSSIGDQMRTFVQQAKGLGYSGARLILNVPEELTAQVPSENVWLDLDKVREELGMTFVSLYDMTVLSPGFLLQSLSSYLNVIMDGTLCRNFYYLPSLGLPQRDAYRDLCEQLESIREERDLRQNEDHERSKLMEMNRELQEEMIQRRMVEFALLRAENNLRTMLDAMSDMVFMVDRDLRVTNGNQNFVRYLEERGFDTSFEGRFVYDMFPGAPLEGQKLFEEVFRFGYPTAIEESFYVGDEIREAEVRLVPVKVGSQVDRVVVIAHPRTATDGDEEGMWEKADMLRDDLLDPTGPAAGAMEFCPHPVLVTDPEGKLYRVNAALGRELGCSAEEVLAMGNAYRFLEPQKDGEGHIRRINADGRISIPSILTRRDGSTLKVMCYVVHAIEGAEPRRMTVIRSGP
jgi:PAS domain-containing protein